MGDSWEHRRLATYLARDIDNAATLSMMARRGRQLAGAAGYRAGGGDDMRAMLWARVAGRGVLANRALHVNTSRAASLRVALRTTCHHASPSQNNALATADTSARRNRFPATPRYRW